MVLLLIANILFEGGLGILFFIAPQAVPGFENASPQTLIWIRTYGCAAITVAYFSVHLLTNTHEYELLVRGLLTMFVFHTLLTIAELLNASVDPSLYTVAVVHGIFALGFLIYYLREK
ncbi:MAG TPA: hypothetical protein DCM08_13780 [Microscillaceae bacterium]|jgi:hypothetical protein|nr:hypothetical protein [Microscillaceae bacterium]